MTSAPSLLSYAASGLYGVVIVTCVAAFVIAMRGHQNRTHLVAWLLLAAFFLVLVWLRLYEIEDLWRGAVRDWLKGEDTFGERRTMQRPIAAGAVAVIGLLGFWWFYRTMTGVRGRRNIAVSVAMAAGGAMLALIALRLISLHPVDTVLYGPIKLNWIIDIGSSLAVMASAAFYVSVVASRRR